MVEKGKGNRKNPTGNPWGHYRRSAASLKRIGDEVVQDRRSNHTVGDIQIDYPLLLAEVYQLGQYVSTKRKRGQDPSTDEVLQVFSGKGILVGDDKTPGYATRLDVEGYLQTLRPGPTPFEFARNLMAKAWTLERSTIDSYLKPNRKKTKKS